MRLATVLNYDELQPPQGLPDGFSAFVPRAMSRYTNLNPDRQRPRVTSPNALSVSIFPPGPLNTPVSLPSSHYPFPLPALPASSPYVEDPSSCRPDGAAPVLVHIEFTGDNPGTSTTVSLKHTPVADADSDRYYLSLLEVLKELLQTEPLQTYSSAAILYYPLSNNTHAHHYLGKLQTNVTQSAMMTLAPQFPHLTQLALERSNNSFSTTIVVGPPTQGPASPDILALLRRAPIQHELRPGVPSTSSPTMHQLAAHLRSVWGYTVPLQDTGLDMGHSLARMRPVLALVNHIIREWPTPCRGRLSVPLADSVYTYSLLFHGITIGKHQLEGLFQHPHRMFHEDFAFFVTHVNRYPAIAKWVAEGDQAPYASQFAGMTRMEFQNTWQRRPMYVHMWNKPQWELADELE